jgi:glycosyltransferase involved in cell wall biosynthesis
MHRLTYLSGSPRVSTDLEAETGGARAHVLGILHGFQSLNWKVQTYIAGDKLPRFVTGQGSEALVTNALYRAFLADLLRMAANTFSSWAVRPMIQDTDLVYERYGAFQAIGRTFQRSGIPWILETQGVDFHNNYKEKRSTALKGKLRRSEIQAYRSCDAIVCSTGDVKQEIVELMGVQPDGIMILPNAVDSEVYDPARFNPERTFVEFTIGFVGRLYPWQGLELLLQALKAIKDEGKVTIRAAIIGDGIDQEPLQNHAARLGLERDVKFVGHVSGRRAAELLLGCDVSYVGHQRLADGRLPFSPIKLYESLSLGVPVIAPREPQFSQVIREGETGLLFSPNDIRSLTECLLAALSMKQQLADAGRRGRMDAIRYHSWTQRVETLLDWVVKERGLLKL